MNMKVYLVINQNKCQQGEIDRIHRKDAPEVATRMIAALQGGIERFESKSREVASWASENWIGSIFGGWQGLSFKNVEIGFNRESNLLCAGGFTIEDIAR